jgi:hypothetical protein
LLEEIGRFERLIDSENYFILSSEKYIENIKSDYEFLKSQ